MSVAAEVGLERCIIRSVRTGTSVGMYKHGFFTHPEATGTIKKDTFVTFWAERIFFCHTYDTSMTIIVTKPSIIIDVVGSYFYDKKS